MKFDRCYRCMEKTESYPCPHCGYTPPKITGQENFLQPGTILGGRYIIGAVLEQGSFDITYSAMDLSNEQKVCVREYFPADQGTRTIQGGPAVSWKDSSNSGAGEYLKVASAASKNLVGTLKENNTVYIITDMGAPKSGAAVRAEAPAVQAEPVAAAAPEAAAPKKKGFPKVLLVILILLALLAAAAAAAYFLYHNWSEADCETPKTCSICGKTDGEALGHSWKDADCEHPKTCTVCEKTEGQALGHSWEDADCEKARTCTVCGLTEGEPAGHSWAEADCENPKTCTDCGKTDGEALGHSWKDADCETPKTCTVCEKTEGEALGHSWKDADCESPKTCTVCGKTEGKALGHSWKDADCENPKTCTACGLTEGEPAGHSWADDDSESAKTCTVCGYTEISETIAPAAAPAEEPAETEPAVDAASAAPEETVPAETVPAETVQSQPASAGPQVFREGNLVTFGSWEQDGDAANGAEPIEWLVLEVSDGSALLISRCGLEAMPFNKWVTSIAWTGCTLRTWLNNDFLNRAFTEQEREEILTNAVVNDSFQGNQEWPANPVGISQDQVFLLSYAELMRYFPAEGDRTCPITAAAGANGAAAGWWLRSPGKDSQQACMISAENGKVQSVACTDDSIAIRPVIRLALGN